MGNICSSQSTEVQSLQPAPIRRDIRINEISAEQIRDLIKTIKHTLFKLDFIDDGIKDMKGMLKDSTQEESIIVSYITVYLTWQTQFQEANDKVYKQVKEIQESLNDFLDELRPQLDQCTFMNEQIRDNEKYNKLKEIDAKVSSHQEEIPNLEAKIREIKAQWNQILVQTEDTETMKAELQKLIHRIDAESSNYKSFLEQIHVESDSLMQFLNAILEDKEVAADYEYKRESLLVMLSKCQENSNQYVKLRERFIKALEQFKEIKRLFNGLIQGQQKITVQQLQGLDSEAQKFMEVNSTLGAEIMSLQKVIQERRQKLQDIDVIENASTRRAEFETLSQGIEDVEVSLDYLLQSLHMKQISAINDEEVRNIDVMIKVVETLYRNTDQKFASAQNDIQSKLIDLENDINDQYDTLKTRDAKTLIPLIQQIAAIGVQNSQLKQEVHAILQEVENQKMNMGEMNAGNKIAQHMDLNHHHQGELQEQEQVIHMMIKMLNELEQYVSEDEEKESAQNIKQDFNKLIDKTQQLAKQCENTEQMLNEIGEEIQKRGLQETEIRQIRQNLSVVEKQINKDDQDVEEIKVNIEKKDQRFKEFDLMNKLKKREKQFEEGKILKRKVKNRSIKMQRKILEKSDKRLNEENKKLLQQLEIRSTNYKKQQEKLADILDGLEVELKNIATQIPVDVLSISIQEQIRLYKVLKNFGANLIQNNQMFSFVRDEYKQMAESIHTVNDEESPERKYLYEAAQEDPMDVLMAEFIKRTQYKKLIIRKTDYPGKYQFGTKEIIAKTENGKLMVKVGGGYTTIDDYILQYGEIELEKQQKQEFDEMNSIHSVTTIQLSPKRSNQVGKTPKVKMSQGSEDFSQWATDTIDLSMNDNLEKVLNTDTHKRSSMSMKNSVAKSQQLPRKREEKKTN